MDSDLNNILKQQRELLEDDIEKKTNEKNSIEKDIAKLESILGKKSRELTNIKKERDTLLKENERIICNKEYLEHQCMKFQEVLKNKDNIINSLNNLNRDFEKRKDEIRMIEETNFSKIVEKIKLENEEKIDKLRNHYDIQKKIWGDKLKNEESIIQSRIDEKEEEFNKYIEELKQQRILKEKELNKRHIKRERSMKRPEKVVEKIVEVVVEKKVKTMDKCVMVSPLSREISCQTITSELPLIKNIRRSILDPKTEEGKMDLELTTPGQGMIKNLNNYYTLHKKNEEGFRKPRKESYILLNDQINYNMMIIGRKLHSFYYKFLDENDQELITLKYNYGTFKNKKQIKMVGKKKILCRGPDEVLILKNDKKLYHRLNHITNNNKTTKQYTLVLTNNQILLNGSMILKLKNYFKIEDIKKIITNTACRMKYD